jgi:hypothetical protein
VTVMTPAAALAIALTCPTLPPSLAPIMVGIAQHESGLNTTAINRNTNGTDDVGLTQVNTANFNWLARAMTAEQHRLVIVSLATIVDPCLNLSAGAHVLFAKYNGNPPDAVKAAYAAGVIAKIPTGAEMPSRQPETDPQPPAWDLEAVADWRRRHAPTAEDAAEAPPPPAIAEPVNQGANR